MELPEHFLDMNVLEKGCEPKILMDTAQCCTGLLALSMKLHTLFGNCSG